VLELSTGDPTVAVLDQPQLVFTPDNWAIPRPVAFRGVDNHRANVDRVIDVTISVIDALSDPAYGTVPSQVFSATVTDDDPMADGMQLAALSVMDELVMHPASILATSHIGTAHSRSEWSEVARRLPDYQMPSEDLIVLAVKRDHPGKWQARDAVFASQSYSDAGTTTDTDGGWMLVPGSLPFVSP
jgi:hypothetical protein